MQHEHISMLLVEDNPGDARLLREMLNDAGGDKVEMTHARTLTEACELLDGQDFDVIVLDLGLPESRGLDTFQRVCQRYEDTPIVVLSGLDDEEVAIQAVQDGAQDYLVKKQISGSSLLRSLRYAIERHRAFVRELSELRRSGESGVIALVGAKGGVGTTTLAVNFGAALAARGGSVIAAELRGRFGTFSSLLPHIPTENVSHLAELGTPRITPQQVRSRLAKTSFGLNVLLGPQEASQEFELEPDVAGALTDALAEISDLAIIDIQAGPSEGQLEALRRVWRIFIVTEPEPAAIRSTHVTLDVLRTAGASGQVAGAIAVNRVARPVMPGVSELSQELGLPIVGVVPPAAEACAVAQQRKQPAVLVQPDSVFAVSVAEIAEDLAAEQVGPPSVW